MKKILNVCMIGAMLVMLLPIVHAMGVTTPYWDTKPLILKPGQSADLELSLQNMVGGEDIILAGRILDGSDIAQIIDTDKRYVVPYGEKDVRVRIRVTLPADAQPSDDPRIVTVSFFNAPQGDGSMVQIGAGVEAKFPVIVEVPEPAGAAGSFPSATLVLAIAAVGIAIAAIFIIQRKRRRR